METRITKRLLSQLDVIELLLWLCVFTQQTLSKHDLWAVMMTTVLLRNPGTRLQVVKIVAVEIIMKSYHSHSQLKLALVGFVLPTIVQTSD